VKVRDATTQLVTVSVLTDGTSGSDDFGAGADATAVIDFNANPDPTISSSGNKTFSVGAGSTVLPTVNLADTGVADYTAANDIRIRIPAGLDASFNTAITAPTLNVTGAGAVNATVSYPDAQTLLIDVTTNFAVTDTLSVDALQMQSFLSESNGSLELSADGGGAWPTMDDKLYSIVDNNPPVIVARDTQDLDGDGFIDAVRVLFSKNIDDTTVVATEFDVAGIGGEAFSSTTAGDIVDDNDIYVTFTDGSLATDATPTVTYTAGTLTDLSGNPLANDGPTASTDLAAPVLLSATSTVGSATLAVTFSEGVDTSNIGPGDLIAADFAYVNVAGGGATAISSMGADADGTDGGVTLTMDAAFALSDFGADTLAAAAAAIFDLTVANNPAATTAVAVTNTDATPPTTTTSTSPSPMARWTLRRSRRCSTRSVR
jgi:hypothetical protein